MFHVYRLLDQTAADVAPGRLVPGATALALAFIVAPALWGFWTSRAGRPLFRDEILEPASQR